MKKITIIFIILILSAAFTFLFAGCNPSTQPSDIVNSYDLSLSYDKNSHTLSGGMRFYFVNECEEEISFLLFNLHANAYREGASYPAVAKEYSSSAYPNGKSYGNISITSVKTDDSALNYEICGEDENLLKVHLSAPLEQGNNVTVEIMYSVKLANVRHRLGYTNRSVNLGNFYPILCYMENNAFCEYPYYNLGDPFVSECANYNVTLICPESYHVAHSGSKISEQKNQDGTTTYKFKADTVRDFALALSENYKVLSGTADNTTINYYYFADSKAESTLELICRALITYNELFGNYPYTDYCVAETDFCYGGMEYPQLVFISSGLVREQYVFTVLHETAHQWWYGIVGNNQISSAWMDEGLSEYSVMLFYKKNPDYGDFDTKLKAAYKSYKLFYDVIKDYNKNFDTSLERLPDKYENFNTYMYLNYTKAMLMFDSLCQTMGERPFLSALKKYCSQYKYTVADKADMINCFEKSFGANLSVWFDKWLGNEAIIG